MVPTHTISCVYKAMFCDYIKNRGIYAYTVSNRPTEVRASLAASIETQFS